MVVSNVVSFHPGSLGTGSKIWRAYFPNGLVQPPTRDWWKWQDPYLMAYAWNDPQKLGTTTEKKHILNPKSRRFRRWVSIFNWMIFRFQPFKKSGVFRRLSSTASFPANWELVNSGASCFFLASFMSKCPGIFAVFGSYSPKSIYSSYLNII